MAKTSREAGAKLAASARTAGYDVARAIAIFGMIHVNLESAMDGGEPGAGPDWLIWLTQRIEGRSAALFVLLAGVGISLRTRRARQLGNLRPERSALMKRAAILYFVGLVHLHMWEWDILHFYGFYLALATVFLDASPAVLWLAGTSILSISAVLQVAVAYDTEIDFWTPEGMVTDMFFNGDHPIFPWMAFLLMGMWVGRHDLRKPEIRRKVALIGLAIAGTGELLDTIVRRAPHWFDGYDVRVVMFMFAWPRPPSPAFVLAAGGTAVLVICIAVAVTEPRPSAKWVVALTATGQFAFTSYLAHTITIVILEQHDLLVQGSTYAAIATSAALNALAVAVALWWRRRWRHGPLEALIRQVTKRADPEPWGAQPLSVRSGQSLPPPRS